MVAVAAKQPGQQEANNREHHSVPEYSDQLKSHISHSRPNDTGDAKSATDQQATPHTAFGTGPGKYGCGEEECKAEKQIPR